MQKLPAALRALSFPLVAVAALLVLGGVGPSSRASVPFVLPSPPTDAQAVREEAQALPVQEEEAVAQAQDEIALWSARLRASGGTDRGSARRLAGWRHALTLRETKEVASEAAARN